MSYSATVVKVLIASPSDVATERRIAREIIHEWNAVNAEHLSVVLMPLAWETDCATDMGARAQAVVNRQLVSGADLLIAVFWTRLGSPTGAAPSGTVEVIEAHLATGKRAMIYFSSAPVIPDSVEGEQYSALRQFRQECQGRVLVEGYRDTGEFGQKLRWQLGKVVLEDYAHDQQLGDEVTTAGPRENPDLCDEARQLLREAALAGDGTVMQVSTMGGTHVQANSKEFTELGNARSEARWIEAAAQLEREGLVEDRGGRGELFFVTDLGHRVADRLRS